MIAIYYNPKTNRRNVSYADTVAKLLGLRHIPCTINPPVDALSDKDCALAIGGDGTVLHTANLLASSKTPLLGINFGHRGFLCEIDQQEAEAGIDKLIKGKFTIEEKTRIQAQIRKRDNSLLTLEALNEISIGGINRTVHLEAGISTPDRSIKAEITGDGLIIATRTGSTAYNINAGGPMLLTDAFTVLANNAFFASDSLLPITKSLVIPTDSTINISDQSHNRANLPFVIADGQDAVKLTRYDQISIQKAAYASLFIKLND